MDGSLIRAVDRRRVVSAEATLPFIRTTLTSGVSCNDRNDWQTVTTGEGTARLERFPTER